MSGWKYVVVITMIGAVTGTIYGGASLIITCVAKSMGAPITTVALIPMILPIIVGLLYFKNGGRSWGRPGAPWVLCNITAMGAFALTYSYLVF